MNNKITFCTYPDTVIGEPVYAIKNYSNETIKNLLTDLEHNTVFYLIEQTNPNEWLKKVLDQVTIIFDCNKISYKQIIETCQKK